MRARPLVHPLVPLLVHLLVLALLPLLACAGSASVPLPLPRMTATSGIGVRTPVAAQEQPGASPARPEAPPAGPEPSTPVVPAVSLPPATLLAPAQGDGLIVSRVGGIVLLDAELKQLAVLTGERGRHLRVVGEELYYFTLRKPVLRALNLNSGETRTVATLPRVKDPCFGGGPPADPIMFVQSEADLTIEAGVLCLDIMDRNANMAAETRNFRVDLATGAVEQRMVAFLGGDACGEIREREQPRLCMPARPAASEQIGPKGRWSFVPDQSRGETGDYVYSLARLDDRTERLSYAIVGRKLRPLRVGRANPVGSCLVPGENTAAWLGVSDVLVLDGCDARLTIVHPPERVDYLKVDGFAVVPR